MTKQAHSADRSIELIELHRIQSDHGNVLSQYTLGFLHEFGYLVPKDIDIAAEWYEKAAEAGYAPAQFALGLLYEECAVHVADPCALEVNDPEEWWAAHLFEEAAKQGHSDAQLKLGMMYENGFHFMQDEAYENSKPDYAEAAKWYEKASKNGHPEGDAYLQKILELLGNIPHLASEPLASQNNQVLQRTAGVTTKKNITAKYLLAKYALSAAHALYREDGTWYHMLKKFPAILFDSNGYVVFKDKNDYETCPQIQNYPLKDQLAVPDGISKMPRYIPFS